MDAGGPRVDGLVLGLVRRTERDRRLYRSLHGVPKNVRHTPLVHLPGLHGSVGDVDASRSTAPRSKSNEEALCAKNYGKGKTAKYRKKKSKGMRRKQNKKKPAQPQEPQAWITMMWHMGIRLPWRWLLGPSNSSERQHVMEMAETGKFPKNTLFCGDAGFVGYPLWSRLLVSGGHFLVRVGANVSLLTEQAVCEFVKEGKN